MKTRSKFLCLALSLLMVLTVCAPLTVSAAGYRVDGGNGSGVVYNGTVYSSYNVHTLTFDPADYVVLPFAGYAGGTYTLDGQYSQAVARGYDVVGVVNGDFANMSTGYLNDYIVTNGEVVIGDDTRHGSMTCVLSDGTIQTVDASQLNFSAYFNGVEVPGGISYINRRPNRTAADGWTDAIYYFDVYAAPDKCPLAGVAVLCKKLNGTVLSIGGTMEAQVVSVEEKPNANGINPAKDEFLLYVRATSPLANTLKALKKGDSVTISTSETVEASVETVTNATSILANIGYLVKDGKNLAADASFNNGAPHSNTYKAQWTAFGTKADGTWVIFTSEGNSGSTGLNLKQVADYMMSLGCTTVIRLDGGGSSAMYLCDDGSGKAGYKENYGRPVADCLIIAKRSSSALQPSGEMKTALTNLMKQAQGSADPYVQTALAHAQSVANRKTSVSGDYTYAMMRLKDALSGKASLNVLMSLALGAEFKQYSEYALTRLREAYADASKVFGSGSSSADDIAVAYARLEKWLNSKGKYSTSDATYPQLTSNGTFYLSRFNAGMQENGCNIFTPGASIEQKYANLWWSSAVLLRKNAHGSYVVEKTAIGGGNTTHIPEQFGFTIVPEDCIVIGAHGACENTVRSAAVTGKIFVPHGFDLANQTVGVGAYFTFETADSGGHTYDWKVTKTPTCTAKGSEILTCAHCGKTTGSPRTIDESGHFFRDGKCLICGSASPAGRIGDVNRNGKLDAMDYVFLKRHILETYKLPDEALALADVDGNGKINAMDYAFLKRAFLGTYFIKDPNV
ncbi:MAG: phosphodiester glycosidase family protein [Oscillospiraceae bacterium]|nr:phosphodiester glycosidase family protein [Oscillospiraceae bacterium]